MCGTMIPTKAISPLTDTAAAVPSVAATTIVSRARPTSIPRLAASSSPRLRTSSTRRCSTSTSELTAMYGAQIATSCQVAVEKPPSSHA